MSNTRQRKAERDAQKQRQQQLYLLTGIVAVALIAILVIVLGTVQATRNTVDTVARNSAYERYTPGVSEEGLPQLGSMDAPLVIHEYSSFGCPHCMHFHDEQFQQLLPEIEAGHIRLVFVPITNSFSNAASEAAYCADQQGMFWEMHDILFSYLGQFGQTAFSPDRLRAAASGLGMDENEFLSCLGSGDAFNWLDDANSMFQTLAGQFSDVTGTPTITFNGIPPEWGSGAPQWDYFQQKINEALAE